MGAALARLPERTARILMLRAQGATLEEIGSAVGLTRERVRQIEEKARERLARDGALRRLAAEVL